MRNGAVSFRNHLVTSAHDAMSLDGFRAGDILCCNTLWRLGDHTNWHFFKLSHMTKKGNWMGHRLDKERVARAPFPRHGRFVRPLDAASEKCVRLPATLSWEKAHFEDGLVFEKDCGDM